MQHGVYWVKVSRFRFGNVCSCRLMLGKLAMGALAAVHDSFYFAQRGLLRRHQSNHRRGVLAGQ